MIIGSNENCSMFDVVTECLLQIIHFWVVVSSLYKVLLNRLPGIGYMTETVNSSFLFELGRF